MGIIRQKILNTVTKKGIFLFLTVGLLLTICVSLIYPSVFYQIMKPSFISHISSIANAHTIRESYIWRNNVTAFQLRKNDYFADLIRNYYSTDKDTPYAEEIQEEMRSYLAIHNLGINDTQLVGKGAITATSYTVLYTDKGDFFYHQEAEELISIIENENWLQELTPDLFAWYSPLSSGKGKDVFCCVYAFTVDEIVCYSMHIMDFQYIKNQFSDLEELSINDYSIIVKDKVIYQNLEQSSQIHPLEYPSYMYEGLQHETVTYEEPDGIYFMSLCSYETEQYHIAFFVPRATLLKPYQHVFLSFQLILYVVVGILSLVICVILKGILTRLTRLNQKMNTVSKGNYSVVLHDNSCDEIGNLTKIFNTMIAQIKSDINHKIEQEKIQQQMQYSLLVSAIDPHFVYNTLNTVSFLAQLGRNEDITDVNNALIAMLKDRLTMKNCKTFDSIKVETQVLEQYILIQNYLCHHKIDFSISVPEDIWDVEIPKNILQPLVENAIQHGISGNRDLITRKVKPGVIRLAFSKTDSALMIELSDNGSGMDEQTIQEYFVDEPVSITQKNAEHIGIHNIRSRLNFLYGKNYKINVSSKKGIGTTVSLIFYM